MVDPADQKALLEFRLAGNAARLRNVILIRQFWQRASTQKLNGWTRLIMLLGLNLHPQKHQQQQNRQRRICNNNTGTLDWTNQYVFLTVDSTV